MKRAILLLLVLSLLMPAPAQAQDETWQDGCDARIIDAIASTTDLIDYHAACAHYRACDPADEGDQFCQFSTFAFMLEQCPQGDDRCHDGALLLAAALLALDYPAGESLGWTPPQSVIDGVPRALAAFWSGDDAAALAAYQIDVSEDFSYEYDVMLPLSRAVLYKRLNQPDAAFAEYEYAFNIELVQLLLLYGRSQLYAALGRADEASFDIAAIAIYVGDHAELNPFIAELQARHPMNEAPMGEWLLYPITEINGGVVGEFITDRSLDPPRPVRFGLFADLNLIVAVGLRNWDADNFGGPDTRTLQVLRGDATQTNFTVAYPNQADGSGNLTLTLQDGVYLGHEYLGFFEGIGEWNFYVAPAGTPDPRAHLEERRYCEGSVLSQLAIGSVVTGLSHIIDEYPLIVSTAPGDTANARVLPPDNSITVVAGPHCIDGVTWWQGYQTTGDLVWFPENDGTLYIALQNTFFATSNICAGSVPWLSPRLRVGLTGTVVPGLGANNLRALPTSDGELLGTIPPEALFKVVGGPLCLDQVVWWYVEYEGLTGWTAEGADGVYWLAPAQ